MTTPQTRADGTVATTHDHSLTASRISSTRALAYALPARRCPDARAVRHYLRARLTRVRLCRFVVISGWTHYLPRRLPYWVRFNAVRDIAEPRDHCLTLLPLPSHLLRLLRCWRRTFAL